jgi:hypothetical protein
MIGNLHLHREKQQHHLLVVPGLCQPLVLIKCTQHSTAAADANASWMSSSRCAVQCSALTYSHPHHTCDTLLHCHNTHTHTLSYVVAPTQIYTLWHIHPSIHPSIYTYLHIHILCHTPPTPPARRPPGLGVLQWAWSHPAAASGDA